MRTTKYFQVSTLQLFFMSILISVLVSSISIINTTYTEYRQLPLVNLSTAGQCINVANFKNGEAYSCADVGTILRNYRTKTN